MLQEQEKRMQGFAKLTPEQRRVIAKKGGESVSRNREHMSQIGKRGGEASGLARKRQNTI